MTMWIILGVLVAGVVLFLVVTSTIDRKKRKKEKIDVLRREQKAQDAEAQVSLWFLALFEAQNEKLKNFVVSIGDFTMSELNAIAKQQLLVIKKSSPFKLLYGDADLASRFEENFDVLIRTKSNNWKKQATSQIAFFVKIRNQLLKDEASLKRLKPFEKEQQAHYAKLFKLENKESELATSNFIKVPEQQKI